MVNLLKKLTDGVPYQERLLFTKHLDTMIRSGIPIDEALETLEDQVNSKSFKKVIKKIISDVKNGQSLTKSFKKHPVVFDDFYVSLIEVGEESGTLEDNLGFLSKQLAKDYSLRKKIIGALFYPALVMGATAGLGIFVSIIILPQLVKFFKSFNVDLPPATKALLFIAETFQNYGFAILFLLVAFLVAFFIFTQMKKTKAIWHAIVIRIPLFGKLLSYGQISRFARNFGTLIQSGVPVTRSLEITANTLSNLKFKNDLFEILSQLNKGKKIGSSMENKKYFEFPSIVTKMISVGEKSGKLDESLIYLGTFYEDEIDDISKNLTTIIEPVLLIVIAIVVGFVALAIISPIYELTGSIRK